MFGRYSEGGLVAMFSLYLFPSGCFHIEEHVHQSSHKLGCLRFTDHSQKGTGEADQACQLLKCKLIRKCIRYLNQVVIYNKILNCK